MSDDIEIKDETKSYIVESFYDQKGMLVVNVKGHGTLTARPGQYVAVDNVIYVDFAGALMLKKLIKNIKQQMTYRPSNPKEPA